MEIVRAATCDDIDALYDLIQRASYGLTSLKLSRDQLLERLEWSQFAFTRKTERPRGEPYMLVMEDLTTGAVVGTSCVFAKTGGYEPLYAYRTVSETARCEEIDVQAQVHSLHLEKIHDGPTEIGSLFLMPEYRGQGRGRLLSMSRFVLIAQRPNRFADEVIAEMRGVSHEDGTCPFWNAIASHFIPFDFPQADALSTVSKRFIEDLMPKHPMYLEMLPEDAREAIGKVHKHTEPALAMLQGEGFASKGFYDIFDAGPVMHCNRDEIRSVAECREATLVGTCDKPEESTNRILGTSATSFRVAQSPVTWESDQEVRLPSLTCVGLGAKQGDSVWILPDKR